MYGHRHGSLTPVLAKPFGKGTTRPSLSIVDVREKPLEWALQSDFHCAHEPLRCLKVRSGKRHIVSCLRDASCSRKEAVLPFILRSQHPNAIKQRGLFVPRRCRTPNDSDRRPTQRVGAEGAPRDTSSTDKAGASTVPMGSSSGISDRIARTDDGDFMSTTTQFLVQKACLECSTVCVRNAGKITQDGHPERATVPRTQRCERRYAIPIRRRIVRGSLHGARHGGLRALRRCVCGPAPTAVKILDLTEFYSQRGGGVRSHLTLKSHVSCRFGHEHVVVAPGPRDEDSDARGAARSALRSGPRGSACRARHADLQVSGRAESCIRTSQPPAAWCASRAQPFQLRTPRTASFWRSSDKVRRVVRREQPTYGDSFAVSRLKAASALAVPRGRLQNPQYSRGTRTLSTPICANFFGVGGPSPGPGCTTRRRTA